MLWMLGDNVEVEPRGGPLALPVMFLTHLLELPILVFTTSLPPILDTVGNTGDKSRNCNNKLVN